MTILGFIIRFFQWILAGIITGLLMALVAVLPTQLVAPVIGLGVKHVELTILAIGTLGFLIGLFLVGPFVVPRMFKWATETFVPGTGGIHLGADVFERFSEAFTKLWRVEEERNRIRVAVTVFIVFSVIGAILTVMQVADHFEIKPWVSPARQAVKQPDFDVYVNKSKAKLEADIKEANKRVAVAEAREAKASAARDAADKALQNELARRDDVDKAFKESRAKQDAANKAYQKALDTQRTADEKYVKAEALEATANRKLDEAKRIEESAEAQVLAADKTKAEAEQMMEAAKELKTEADILVARAEERAREALQNFWRLKSMIEAGTPLRFPLEDHERKDKAQQQENAKVLPVSSLVTPKRTTEDILRDVVWSWCLEKEFGIECDWIEKEPGKLVGEVTSKPRTGYRVSLQGCPLYDPNSVSLYDPGYAPPFFGAFRREYPYNSLTPTEMTRAFWEGKKDDSPWWWEEWWAFRTGADKMSDAKKNELDIPPDHTFALPRDVLPPHVEKLDERYMLSQTLVTQELWESVMGYNPSRFRGTNRPVENVSWDECEEFIAKLNGILNKDGMREKFSIPTGYNFALPLEREWEHACRAGTSTPYHVGVCLDDTQANIGKLLGETSEVGKYSANPWGLYDMHGNVQEWCYDGIGYGPLFVRGRTSIDDDFYRSLRGGSWSLGAEQSRSAYRSSGNPRTWIPQLKKYDDHEPEPLRLRQNGDIGFRLCLVAVKKDSSDTPLN
jgi:hypothetical protein